jgi:uncharacterized membrane protein
MLKCLCSGSWEKNKCGGVTVVIVVLYFCFEKKNDKKKILRKNEKNRNRKERKEKKIERKKNVVYSCILNSINMYFGLVVVRNVYSILLFLVVKSQCTLLTRLLGICDSLPLYFLTPRP